VTEVGSGSHEIVIDGVRARYAPSGDMVYTTQDGKLWAAPFDVGGRRLTGDPRQIADRIPVTIIGPVDFAIATNGTLVYSVDDAGTSRALTWIDRSGRSTPFDSTWKGEFTSPILSPDGSRVAVVVREGSQSHVWTKSVAGGPATRLTLEHRTSIAPAWSPDGRWVSYIAGVGAANSGDVWKLPADGSGRAVRVLQSARPLSEQVWVLGSGDLLVRTTTPTVGTGDILVHSSGDTTAARPLASSPHSEYSPSASPDGKWMAYSSNETGRFEVYVVPIANSGSAKWPVSSGGGLTPRWSPRGDELFYLDLQSNFVAARVTTSPSFAIQGSRILFNASGFVFPGISRHNFDVAPDGQRFLMVQRADGVKSGHVEVVEHLFDKRKRNAPRR
jgi:serine/threonine-protein kinase